MSSLVDKRDNLQQVDRAVMGFADPAYTESSRWRYSIPAQCKSAQRLKAYIKHQHGCSANISMSRGNLKNVPDKATAAEKKQTRIANKAKANPELAEAKKKKNDACRDRRKAAGSSKSFS